MEIPFPLNELWQAWLAFGRAVGRVMSAMILTVLWLVGFGIYAIILKIARLFGKHEKQETYWIEMKKTGQESMKYQF